MYCCLLKMNVSPNDATLSVFKLWCRYTAKLLSDATYFFLHFKLHRIDPKPFHLNFCNVSQ